MRINGEPVERVTSFDQLRTGMIVYDEACTSCGRPWCRTMLGRLRETRSGDAFESVPPCREAPEDRIVATGPDAVAAGRIYRVVDDALEDPADYAAIIAVNEGLAKAKVAEREPEKAGGLR